MLRVLKFRSIVVEILGNAKQFYPLTLQTWGRYHGQTLNPQAPVETIATPIIVQELIA
jgi:hypothetical protein